MLFTALLHRELYARFNTTAHLIYFFLFIYEHKKIHLFYAARIRIVIIIIIIIFIVVVKRGECAVIFLHILLFFMFAAKPKHQPPPGTHLLINLTNLEWVQKLFKFCVMFFICWYVCVVRCVHAKYI